jgi:hypothetical protein
MTFIGQVQRLGWLSHNDLAWPAALFVFDDTLIFVELRLSVALRGLGWLGSKKDQDAIKTLSELDVLTPQLVMDRWPKALNLATARIVKAQLVPDSLGNWWGITRLKIDLQGWACAYKAHRTAKEPLVRMLQSVLGDRFESS